MDIYANVALMNLTIQNGKRSDGGAIINHAALSLINSTFRGNTANNNAGAIYNYLGPLTIVNSTFSNNSISRRRRGDQE